MISQDPQKDVAGLFYKAFAKVKQLYPTDWGHRLIPYTTWIKDKSKDKQSPIEIVVENASVTFVDEETMMWYMAAASRMVLDKTLKN